MGNNVLVIAEQRDGVLKKVAFEMLGIGAELAAALGGSVEAALLGSELGDLPAISREVRDGETVWTLPTSSGALELRNSVGECSVSR